MAPGPTTARPEWLERSLAMAPVVDSVNVAGCDINLLVWGEAGRPGLVLVHGGAAHAHWWAPIAPLIGEAVGRTANEESVSSLFD